MTGVDTQGPIAFIYAHWAFKFQVSSFMRLSSCRHALQHRASVSRIHLLRGHPATFECRVMHRCAVCFGMVQ